MRLRATQDNGRADTFDRLLMLPPLQGDQPQRMGCAWMRWHGLKICGTGDRLPNLPSHDWRVRPETPPQHWTWGNWVREMRD